jgi:hypothetical protein
VIISHPFVLPSPSNFPRQALVTGFLGVAAISTCRRGIVRHPQLGGANKVPTLISGGSSRWPVARSTRR